MKTVYAACLSRLGLSRSEAANLHEVRIDTVKSWCAGRRAVPTTAWDDLRDHERRIVDASESMRAQWQAAGEPPVDIDDSEANGPTIMAVADFVLGIDAPVEIGRSRATEMARQARRPN